MGVWDTARGLLAGTVVQHLGEDLTLLGVLAGGQFAAETGGYLGGPDPVTETVRGVLTRPEELIRMGLSHVVQGDARLTIRTADAPDWTGRGVTVQSAGGEVFEVTAVADNGEGLLEVTLCRSS